MRASRKDAIPTPALKALQKLGVTQVEVAEKAAVTQGAVSLQLSGRMAVSVDVARACSDLSGVSMGRLFPDGTRVADEGRSRAQRTARARRVRVLS